MIFLNWFCYCLDKTFTKINTHNIQYEVFFLLFCVKYTDMVGIQFYKFQITKYSSIVISNR